MKKTNIRLKKIINPKRIYNRFISKLYQERFQFDTFHTFCGIHRIYHSGKCTRQYKCRCYEGVVYDENQKPIPKSYYHYYK